MPEQFPLPGIAFGQRWVSTPACRRRARRRRRAARADPLRDAVPHDRADRRDTCATSWPSAASCTRSTGSTSTAGRTCRVRSVVDGDRGRAARARLRRGRPVPRRTGASTSWSPTATSPARRPASTRRRGRRVPGVAGVWTFRLHARRSRPAGRPAAARSRCAGSTANPLAGRARSTPGSTPGSRAAAGGWRGFAGPFETVVPWQWDWFDADDRLGMTGWGCGRPAGLRARARRSARMVA